MRKTTVVFLLLFALVVTVSFVSNSPAVAGFQSMEKSLKDFKSSWLGIDRKIQIFTKTGDVVYEFQGEFDIDTDKQGRIVFDADGKRVITNMDYIAVEVR